MIPFWHEAHNIFLSTSHLFLLVSSSPIPHHQIINTQRVQLGGDRSEANQSTGRSSNTSLLGPQQEPRHQIVNRDTANKATKHMTQDGHSKIICKTRSSENINLHAIAGELVNTVVMSRQLTEWSIAGVPRVLWDQCTTACNGKSVSWT